MGIARTSLKGVTHYVPSKAYKGYTLFTPMFGNDAWLIDMQGRIVHHWSTEPYKPNFARFLTNGNLVYQGVKSGGIMGPGVAYLFGEDCEQNEQDRGVCLIEVDWDNNLVLKYEEPQFNHDFYRMENGNTMLIKYVTVPDDIKSKVKGGIPGTELSGGVMWADALNEVTPEGKVVWEWLSYEHIDPEIDVICPLEYRGEWTHMNGCTVLPDGNILGSFRQTNTICIIDKATGKITWRWGPGELGHQHEPTMLDNGNILVFDNGAHRFFSQDLDYYSRVLEVNPATNKIEWEYKDDPPSEFYAFGMGGAQRLSNGNTLICETHGGRIFEVTPDCEIVWEYISPFYGPFVVYGQANLIYRAYRYGHEHEGLIGKNLDPDKFEWLNGIYGPDAT